MQSGSSTTLISIAQSDLGILLHAVEVIACIKQETPKTSESSDNIFVQDFTCLHKDFFVLAVVK